MAYKNPVVTLIKFWICEMYNIMYVCMYVCMYVNGWLEVTKIDEIFAVPWWYGLQFCYVMIKQKVQQRFWETVAVFMPE
jgi:hypothetical protein